MANPLTPLWPRNVRLLPSIFSERAGLNRRYMMSLDTVGLLQNHYMEAGLWSSNSWDSVLHRGWESPCCQVRGQFLGHWLSAAARATAAAPDIELKAKADFIVSELARCQKENGGEWVFSIPQQYLHWIARGKPAWAPHYVVHKTLMGLVDMAVLGSNEQALDILQKTAAWFLRWTKPFSRSQMDDILDVETGGMLEVWADLYALTGKAEHLELMNRYDRPRLFDRLLAGEDALSNQHANTTIPEALGAARAYEVTGDKRWRDIVDAYWHCAVTIRGAYCTGGQSCGEVWTAPQQIFHRLAERTQEHCTVYNMMRLAETLLRWTGDVEYAGYWEKNAWNGVLAQQHPGSGMVTYYLGTQAGSVKKWGRTTEDFWCCHGTLMQAQTSHAGAAFYRDAQGLRLASYVPCEGQFVHGGATIRLRLTQDPQRQRRDFPTTWAYDLAVAADKPTKFTLRALVPQWVASRAKISVNGKPLPGQHKGGSYCQISRTWGKDTVRVELPIALSTSPLPDRPDTMAFMYGPMVLAGIVDEERMLHGDPKRPETILDRYIEREWNNWRTFFRTVNQERNFNLWPLHEVHDERYTLYFPVRSRASAAEGTK